MPNVANHDAGTWTITLPFLMLAYPVTFLLFQDGQYCGPACFRPTPVGIATVVVSLLTLGVLASGIALGLRVVTEGTDRIIPRRLAAPPRLASFVLFCLFGAFVVFLTLDALALYGAIWKPIILPISFLLFFPVWVLYAATFPLAVVFSVVGIDPPLILTLLTRMVLLAVGFPTAAVIQTFVASAVVSNR